MNLRTEFAWLIGDKPITDALTQMATRINLVFTREHDGNTGIHRFPTGVWLPTVGGTGGESGQTYAQQDGSWVKAGQVVSVACRVQLATLGTITGVVQIKGLPFPVVNRSGYRATGVVAWANTTTAYTNIVAIAQETSPTALTLFAAGAATTNLTAQTLVQADLAASTRFIVSVEYETEV